MLRATHLSVGVATALAVLRPGNLSECLAVTGIAAVGSVISDIDADQVPCRSDQILKREPDHVGTQRGSGRLHYLMRDRKDDAAPVIHAFPGCRSDLHHGYVHHVFQTGGTGVFSRISDAYPAGPAKLQGDPAFLADPGASLFQALRLQWMGQPDFMPGWNGHDY